MMNLCHTNSNVEVRKKDRNKIITFVSKITKAVSVSEGKNRCGDAWTVDVIVHILSKLKEREV